jgi:hypothetical protein
MDEARVDYGGAVVRRPRSQIWVGLSKWSGSVMRGCADISFLQGGEQLALCIRCAGAVVP